MPQVKVGKIAREQRRIGQTRGRIFFRVARDRDRLLDGLCDRIRLQVGSARRTLALAEIDRDAERAVARVFDRFNLADARIHAQAVSMLAPTSASLAPAARQRPITSLRDLGEAIELGETVVGRNVVFCD